jgi:hypothetical protein
MTETPITKQQAVELLATLGLAFRIEDEIAAQIEAITWSEITRLANHVIECVTFTKPPTDGRWLRIDKLRTTPDSGSWVRYEAVESVYWIAKTDLPRLLELENYLDLAVDHAHRAAQLAG